MAARQNVPTWIWAVVNHGRWIVECPFPYCGGAEEVTRGQSRFVCINCAYECDVRWDPESEKIWQALALRPVPQTRNWAPAGHRQAITDGFPEGQTWRDLMDENVQYGVVN
jgi:hypothetical protein